MTVTKDLVIPDEWQKKFDLVVKECSGALGTGMNSIKDSLMVMNGIRSLKAFFNTPEVKELVEFAQDTKAGFMTDRSPAAIRRQNAKANKKYDIKPYTYSQVVDALLPCVLEGYTMHGNEINIIAGNGLPVKNGKYNKITGKHAAGFREKIGVPATRTGETGFIFVRCSAEWMIGGEKQHIGVDESDACVFKIAYDGGRYDSIDKIIGLAQSKLYTRVLARITGKFIPEEPSGDVLGDAQELTDEPDGPPPTKPSASKKKAKKEAKPVEKAAEKAPPVELHTDAQHLKELYENKAYAKIFDEMIFCEEVDGHQIRAAIDGNRHESAAQIIEMVEKRIAAAENG